MVRTVGSPVSLSPGQAAHRSTGADTAGVTAAIARAAEATGADFEYLLAQARLESAMDPNAQARTSSAGGLYQFIDSTWLSTLDRHGHRLGYGDAADAIANRGGRSAITDPALSPAIHALKFNPLASAMMAGALAQDNTTELARVLGRAPDATELYMAHFLGAAGAGKFLTTLASAPSTSAAALLPQAASANRAIFFSPSGQARSVEGVMELMRGKMTAAMAAGGTAPAHAGAGSIDTGFRQVAREFYPAPRISGGSYSAVAAAHGSDGALRSRQSMADLLQSSFGSSQRDMPAHVRSAYDKLKAMDL